MIVSILKDGLGNQLFQYAAGKALATFHGTTFKLDVSSYKSNPLRKYSLSHFCIEGKFVNIFELLIFRFQLLLSILFKKNICIYFKKINETEYYFKPLLNNVKNNSWIEGYWQSEKYFDQIGNIINSEFRVKTPPSTYFKSLIEMANSSNSVSIHIRRGDYANNNTINHIHGLCSRDYYEKSVEYIKKVVSDPLFFFFTDDINWVKNNFYNFDNPYVFIDNSESRDYEELRLMYNCKHNIIANSSFSWWGAWLNSNPDKLVIAPQRWTKDEYYFNPDIIPDNWIRIDA